MMIFLSGENCSKYVRRTGGRRGGGQPKVDKLGQGGGFKNHHFFADVFYGWALVEGGIKGVLYIFSTKKFRKYKSSNCTCAR